MNIVFPREKWLVSIHYNIERLKLARHFPFVEDLGEPRVCEGREEQSQDLQEAFVRQIHRYT